MTSTLLNLEKLLTRALQSTEGKDDLIKAALDIVTHALEQTKPITSKEFCETMRELTKKGIMFCE